MKLLSWNINGLRAVEKKGIFPEIVSRETYDVIFLQETKCELDQLSPTLTLIPGYSFHLQPSSYKKGYAGVAFYTKNSLQGVSYISGFSHATNLHDEERILTLTYTDPVIGRVALTGCYFPNGARGTAVRGKPDETTGYDNLSYKLDFFTEFHKHMNHLRSTHSCVFVFGDINIAHHPIDLARPDSNKKSIGFLLEERAKLDEWVQDGWVDIFRSQNSEAIQYSWWDVISRARDRNVGWRIDSLWCKGSDLFHVKQMTYLSDTMGSDHCPLYLEY
jgi:exodeoxyribonuclease-3